MALFQKSVLNQHLNSLDTEKVMLAYEKFTRNYNPTNIEEIRNFNSYKTEINNLQTKITQTDQKIDQMVYKLYGLTDEEIGVVEGA